MNLKTGSDFDGDTYEPYKDKARLTGQLKKVYNTMSDGQWWTLHGIRAWMGRDGKTYSEAGISARIRDLRKEKFGGFEVQRKRTGGLFHYKLIVGQMEMFSAD